MNIVILVAGIAGLAVAGYGFGALTVDAWRHRQYWHIGVAALLAVALVYLLINYGDSLLR